MSSEHKNPSPNKPEKPKINMEDFRAEIIRRIAEVRQAQKEYEESYRIRDQTRIAQAEKDWTGGTELLEVNPDELTEIDAEMYYRIKNYKEGSDPLITEDFEKYRNGIDKTGRNSRGAFGAMLLNIIHPIILKKQLDGI